MRASTPAVAPEAGATPLACPSCGAGTLTTASKTINESTYWRCLSCGEIWNPGRREEGQRFALPRR